jgi:23S rRNA pseudouridine1911/1915/1917 synthase
MKTTSEHYTIVIPEEHKNERLDQALAKLMPAYSRTQIQSWIESGHVLLNAKPVKGKLRVQGGETVTVEALPREVQTFTPQAITLNVVYEDDAIIIINKPIGMVVHPGAGNADSTLLNALLHHAPSLSALPRAGILHRLDKNTSGLLVIAKTEAALKSLSHQLKKRLISREYQAIVYGKFISGGTIDAPIERHPRERKRMAVSDTGKPAVTHYRVAEKFRAHTRLLVALETGRTHQIRVHMQHIHHPIVGDPVYGGRVQLAKGMTPELIQALRQFKRQALHAYALTFTHPETDETVRFEAPIPADMEHLLTILRQDKESP